MIYFHRYPPDDEIVATEIATFDEFWQCQTLDTEGSHAPKPMTSARQAPEMRILLSDAHLSLLWRDSPAIREAWAKRRYEAHFLSKLSDCDGEINETDSALDFAKDCGYISPQQHQILTDNCAEIGRMLGGMMKKYESFLASE